MKNLIFALFLAFMPNFVFAQINEPNFDFKTSGYMVVGCQVVDTSTLPYQFLDYDSGMNVLADFSEVEDSVYFALVQKVDAIAEDCEFWEDEDGLLWLVQQTHDCKGVLYEHITIEGVFVPYKHVLHGENKHKYTKCYGKENNGTKHVLKPVSVAITETEILVKNADFKFSDKIEKMIERVNLIEYQTDAGTYYVWKDDSRIVIEPFIGDSMIFEK